MCIYIHKLTSLFLFSLQLSGMPMTDEDSLDDLSDIVGPELAGLVNAPVMQPVKTTVTSQASFTSDMPPDISDLRSSDLLQTLSGVIDIDKVFADIQAEQHQQQRQHDVRDSRLYLEQFRQFKTKLKFHF
jgi:hypothetical protein